MMNPAERLPHPSTVPSPASLYFRLHGREMADVRAMLLTEVGALRIDYTAAHKMFVTLFPDSAEAKEHTEKTCSPPQEQPSPPAMTLYMILQEIDARLLALRAVPGYVPEVQALQSMKRIGEQEGSVQLL